MQADEVPLGLVHQVNREEVTVMPEDAVIAALRREQQAKADSKTRESGGRFFKEAVKLYGEKTAL